MRNWKLERGKWSWRRSEVEKTFCRYEQVTLVVSATCQVSGYGVDALMGRDRRRPLVVWRQLLMYLCRERTVMNDSQLASVFNRERATLRAAHDNVTAWLAQAKDGTEYGLTIRAWLRRIEKILGDAK